jgi:hypothetical protein
MRTVFAAVVIVGLAIPLSARAQDKATLIADYTRAKSTVLAYVDAMPDSALGFRPTPGVRSFAEQIEHIVVTHYEVAAMTLGSVERPSALGDSATYLHKKAALRAVSAKAFDFALAALQKATPATLAKSSAIYEQPPAPAFKWMAMSLEHGTWTLGQTVPYLRLNKVTPPTYQIPF